MLIFYIDHYLPQHTFLIAGACDTLDIVQKNYYFLFTYLCSLAVSTTRTFRQFFFSDFCDVETGKGISDFVTHTAELRVG